MSARDNSNQRGGIDASEVDVPNDGGGAQTQQTREESSEDTPSPEEQTSITDRLQDTPGPFAVVMLFAYRLVAVPLSILAKWVPKTSGLGYTLFYTGLRMIRDNSRADGVTFVFYGDKKMVPRPNQWNSADMSYETSNGEEFSADAEGHRPYDAGGVDVTFALRGSAQVFEPIQAFVAQKHELGQWLEAQLPYGKDVLFDTSMPHGMDGMILSWEKAWEQFGAKISREDLQEQHRIGYLEALEEDLGNKLAMYTLLAYVGGLASALVMFYVFIRVFGGGGGGGLPGSGLFSGFMAIPWEVFL